MCLMSRCHAEDKSAQVYEIKVSVKTAAVKTGKLSSTKNPFIEESDTVHYRIQGTQKWNGLIWGCDCEAIKGVWKLINGENAVAGCAIWNAKSPYNILFLDDMNWKLLHAIDAKGDKCEGAWTIGDSSDDSNPFLSFSGFGKLDVSTTKEDGSVVVSDCMSYVKNISGNVAGWMFAPEYVVAGKPPVCTFCGIDDEGEDDIIDVTEAWSFCPCDDFGKVELTAVFGTWSIKYNAKLSQKLSDVSSIITVYKKFPKNVEEAITEKINEISGS